MRAVFESKPIRTLAVAVLGAWTLLAAGCGGSAGANSPEEAARAFVDAARTGAAEGIKGAFPGRGHLNTAMQCRAGEGIHDRVADELRALLRELPALKKWRTYQDINEAERRTVKVGDVYKGCEARVPLVFWRGTVTFEAAIDGGLEERTETLRMVQLGDAGWFILSI